MCSQSCHHTHPTACQILQTGQDLDHLIHSNIFLPSGLLHAVLAVKGKAQTTDHIPSLEPQLHRMWKDPCQLGMILTDILEWKICKAGICFFFYCKSILQCFGPWRFLYEPWPYSFVLFCIAWGEHVLMCIFFLGCSADLLLAFLAFSMTLVFNLFQNNFRHNNYFITVTYYSNSFAVLSAQKLQHVWYWMCLELTAKFHLLCATKLQNVTLISVSLSVKRVWWER